MNLCLTGKLNHALALLGGKNFDRPFLLDLYLFLARRVGFVYTGVMNK